MDKRGLDPLLSTLSRIGGWPMTMDPDEWDEREYDWRKVDDQYMRLTGRNVFHDVYVYKYDYNESEYTTIVSACHATQRDVLHPSLLRANFARKRSFLISTGFYSFFSLLLNIQNIFSLLD